MIRVTLPADLAAQAGGPEVDLEVNGDDHVSAAYRNGERLRCFSWNDYGILQDLYDLATKGAVQPSAEAMARVGTAPYRAKKRRKARREDDRLRAGDGKRYEDV